MPTKLLITETGKTYLLKDFEKDFHTKHGHIKAQELKKAKPGDVLTTNLKKTFYVSSPTFIDLFNHIKRSAQITIPKDIGSIIAHTGIGKDSKVVDAGSGSGALASFLGHVAKEVTTYDNREDHHKIAKKNIEFLQLKNVTAKQGNVYENIEEKNVDVITLDLPEPWNALEQAHKALKHGGRLACYLPNIPQVMKLIEQVKKEKLFFHLSTIEVIEREWHIKENIARPKNKQEINHTAFLSFFRKN